MPVPRRDNLVIHGRREDIRYSQRGQLICDRHDESVAKFDIENCQVENGAFKHCERFGYAANMRHGAVRFTQRLLYEFCDVQIVLY